MNSYDRLPGLARAGLSICGIDSGCPVIPDFP